MSCGCSVQCHCIELLGLTNTQNSVPSLPHPCPFLSSFPLFYLYITFLLHYVFCGSTLPLRQCPFIFFSFSFSHSSPSLFTLLSSHPYCQREAIGCYHTDRAGMAGYTLTNWERFTSLSQPPAFCGSNAFSFTAASGVWESAAAVWGSCYLWGVLHPDVYAACHHK